MYSGNKRTINDLIIDQFKITLAQVQFNIIKKKFTYVSKYIRNN